MRLIREEFAFHSFFFNVTELSYLHTIKYCYYLHKLKLFQALLSNTNICIWCLPFVCTL